MERTGKRDQGRREQLKLAPALVPKPLWGVNAHRRFGRAAVWQRIRAASLEESKGRCSICGTDWLPFNCHEVWSYEDRRRVATLAGFRMVCDDCHDALHAGRTISFGEADRALIHLSKVNGIKRAEAEQLIAASMIRWAARSEQKWRVAVAPLILEAYPELRALVGIEKGPEGRVYSIKRRR